MGGYIGAKTGTLVASASDIRGDISATDTTPEITLKNTTETDADGTRSGKITFKGEQSGGEESVLAQIQGSHDGTADDEKGDLIFKTNDGNDASSPTERVRINSAGDVLVSSPDPSLTITNTTHEDTDGGRESTIVFKGEQSGGELSTLAEIEASHDGTADDEKGDLIFKTNDGSDGASPTERVRIDSNGSILTATLGTDNVHLGEGAGVSIASGGNNNVAVGKDAGTALTTGDNNIAIGYEALKTEDGHGNNTAVGYQALKTQNAGANAANTAIGYQAGLDLTDGHSEVFVGTLAGANVTTGDANTFVGYTAGTAVTVGANNTAFGFEALATDTQGSHSTAIGRRALKSQNFTSATDSHNSGIGNNAGQSITTASSNTAVGSNALSSNQTGNSNTALGKGAGQSTTVAAGTYVGAQAGENTNSVSNTFIGCSAGELVTSGQKNTILGRYNGNENGLDIRTSNNYIVLSDGDGNPRCYWDNVGGLVNHMSQASSFCASFKNSNTSGYGIASDSYSGYQVFWYHQGSNVGSITSSSSSVSYNSTSDHRLKENVTDVTDGITRVKQLAPKRFNFIVDADTTVDGFLAHEAQAVVPEAVTGTHNEVDDDGNPVYQGIDQSKLVPLLTAALQEAIAKIETLETQNTTQATQIADLITRVEALEGA